MHSCLDHIIYSDNIFFVAGVTTFVTQFNHDTKLYILDTGYFYSVNDVLQAASSCPPSGQLLLVSSSAGHLSQVLQELTTIHMDSELSDWIYVFREKKFKTQSYCIAYLMGLIALAKKNCRIIELANLLYEYKNVREASNHECISVKRIYQQLNTLAIKFNLKRMTDILMFIKCNKNLFT